MTIDTLAIRAICDQLHSLVGAKIQDSVIASPHSIALELYHHRQRQWLLVSAHPKWARIALHQQRIPRGVDHASPLLLLLRKYVEGGRISAVTQPDLERIIVLSIVKNHEPRNTEELATDEAPTLTMVQLVVEIMDQRSNIFLLDEQGTILECVKRVTAQMSRRTALPQHAYQPPPPIVKADPRQTATAEMLTDLAAQPDLAKALVATFRGVSPLLAREAVARGHHEVTAVVHALRDLFCEPQQACIVADPHSNQPIQFAAYHLSHVTGAQRVDSINDAVVAYYTAHEMLGDYQRRRDFLRQRIGEYRERIERQLLNLRHEMTRADAMDQLRWEGEMIYAYMHEITPDRTELVVDGQIIKLEPRVNPSLQAQARFKAYDKAKAAVAGLPERITTAETELSGIDETLAYLAMADTFENIESVARDALQAGWLRSSDIPKQARARPVPPLRIVIDDSTIAYVGRNAYQNQLVTFTIGDANDLWLHVRGIPGAHVIVKHSGRALSDQALLRAAQLAAYYSSHRHEPAVDVDLCRRSAVRRIKGGPVGLVSYHADTTMRVAPKA
jgi:predicted ribosome quality control (RQC) complex YloA/Tae2 family protein